MLHAIKTMKPHDSEYYTEIHLHCFLCNSIYTFSMSCHFLCHYLSLGKYRTQKQSPPGTEQRHTEGRFRVTAATSQPVRAEEAFPPGRLSFWILSGGWMPPKSASARTMASAFWWWITITPKSLENHRKNQEIGLLYDPPCALVMMRYCLYLLVHAKKYYYQGGHLPLWRPRVRNLYDSG
jgi:hypothetical protein